MFCRNGPKRPAYLESFWKVLNWQQVSKNYDSAVQGERRDLCIHQAAERSQIAADDLL
jgi:hypothetical protein